ncbi:eCIS core domain-containing protein [Metapseudomonas resinovorans]|uniref:eCIS core domain-containing protein n=1 Tax=Metapseudomonas resinovorans TaxID=53412 RepID=UPI001B7F803E|nr:DUF4157 domain-containing protein [Pseudomonas resinovorans]
MSRSPLASGPSSCACGGGCPRCQPKSRLKVGAREDAAEREADAMADQVMGTPSGTVSTGPQGDDRPKVRLQPSALGGGAERPAPASVDAALNASGQPLDRTTRAYFEPRFGHDFSGVRVHTDMAAQRSAREVNAHAYTVGQDIVFDAGQFAPASREGQHLLAHELTHVVQQRGTAGAVLRRDPGDEELTPEIVGQEPGLLLCFALCELGVPPAIWRDITEMFLGAVWEEYRESYGRARGNARFRTFQNAFRSYSVLNSVKTILGFVVHGRVGFIPIRTASGRAAQQALLRFLIARGATEAGVIAAEQLVRRIAIAIEVAIAAGCGAFCSVRSYALLMRDLADQMAAGLVAVAEGMESLGGIVSGLATAILVRPVLYAETLLEVSNWNLSHMPAGARADTIALGLYFSSVIEGEDFDTLIASHARPISSYPTAASLVREVIAEINRDRVITEEPPLDTESLVNGNPAAFFSLLAEQGYLDFEEDPEQLVDAMLEGPSP